MALTSDYVVRSGFLDQLWLQLWLQCPLQLAPEGLRHPVRRVLAERSRDVRVALGLAELRVPEDFLNYADADALVEQQGRRRVAGIMDPGVAELSAHG